MSTAYTPGLRATEYTVIHKIRRLPLKGKVLVQLGDCVQPETVLARAEIPGPLQSVKLAEQLGIEPFEVEKILQYKIGDPVQKGDLLAEKKSLFGLVHSECRSPVTGIIELITPVAGNVGIRIAPTPIEISAYVTGTVVQVLPEEGAVVECKGAFIQGIFGVGGERHAPIRIVVDSPETVLTADLITEKDAGSLVVGGSMVTGDALKKAAEVGIKGVVVGGVLDEELTRFLGYEIGVAITGEENIPLTLIITEGFGIIPMRSRVFRLLKSLESQLASLNGATQIRAGVIRPEIIVPSTKGTEDEGRGTAADEKGNAQEKSLQLVVGTQVRLIREPYFGVIAKVSAMPTDPVMIETGATVRVLEAELPNGKYVTVPRANVECLEG